MEEVSTEKVQSEKDLSDVKSKNKLRKTIKSCFKNRTCLAFGRPANDESVLKKIDNEDQIRPEFKDDVEDLMKLLTMSILPKSANKSFLTGSIFFKFVDLLLNQLNSGETPVLSSAVERLLSAETETKAKKIIAACSGTLESLRDRFPMNPVELARKAGETIFDYQEVLREGIGFMASKDTYTKYAKSLLKAAKDILTDLEAGNQASIKKSTSELIASFERALPPTTGVAGADLGDFAAAVRPLFSTYFTGGSRPLDWQHVASYLGESLFSQFEGAAARAASNFASQTAAFEQSLEEAKAANKRIKAAMQETEAGLDELRRGKELDRERSEDLVADAKEQEIRMLRDKLARAEARYEKEKESQQDFRQVLSFHQENQRPRRSPNFK